MRILYYKKNFLLFMDINKFVNLIILGRIEWVWIEYILNRICYCVFFVSLGVMVEGSVFFV